MRNYQVNWHVHASECERCQGELLGLGLNVVHQLKDGQPEQTKKGYNDLPQQFVLWEIMCSLVLLHGRLRLHSPPSPLHHSSPCFFVRERGHPTSISPSLVINPNPHPLLAFAGDVNQELAGHPVN